MINRRIFASSLMAGAAVRRAPLVLGAAAVAELAAIRAAQADQNYTSFAYNATGGTTPRTSPARWADVLNVKDYGAVGDGSNDDTAAIQATFNAAFGSAASPHGNVDGSNIAVYIPRGLYKISSSLVLTAVWGGRIYGDGIHETKLFTNALVPVASEGWRPMLWLNGCNYVTFEGLTFSGIRDNTTVTLTSISNGSPAVFTKNSHGLVEGEIITLVRGADTLPAPLQSSTTLPYETFYYVVNPTTNTFNVALSQGGTAINTTSAGSGTHAYNTRRTVGIWLGPDGGTGGSSGHGNNFISVNTTTTNYGWLFGSAASAANSENTFISCYGELHDVGMYVSGGNTLNFRLYGGGWTQCAIAGVKTNNSATIPIIDNPALDNNGCDFDFASAGYSVVAGLRSESHQIIKTNASTSLFTSFSSGVGGTITGSTSGPVLTVTATTAAQGIRYGVMIRGGTGGNNLPDRTQIISQITDTSGSGPGNTGTYLLSNSGTPGDIASTTFTLNPVYANIIGAGTLVLDSCGGFGDTVIIGNSNGGALFIRNNHFLDQIAGHGGGISANLLTYCLSRILDYDVCCLGQNIVADLPTPSSSLKGVRMFVTDSSLAVTSNVNFGSVVASGGANAVPVWCDGTNWRIG